VAERDAIFSAHFCAPRGEASLITLQHSTLCQVRAKAAVTLFLIFSVGCFPASDNKSETLDEANETRRASP
jgi:hypothetical protein